MKFVIGANNLKTFAKSILSLSKIGDEIYIEPVENQLTIRTVNSSRSAFACFSFNQTFFTHFDPHLKNQNLNATHADQTLNITNLRGALDTNNDNSIEELDPFKCKIPSKCLLSIFKNINSLEKNVEKCTITVKYIPLSQEAAAKVYDYETTMVTKMLNKNNEEQLFDIKFLIIINCKYGIRKTFILSISDCENLQAAFSPQSCSNKLNISAKYLHETINSFSNDTEEVSFMLDEARLNIKNYVEPENADAKSQINTQVTFDRDEFQLYEIEKETDITFCLKEFKVCLAFGYWFDLALEVYFKKKGRPIIFLYNGNSYQANFTLATLLDDLTTTQNTSISTNPNMSIQAPPSQMAASTRNENSRSKQTTTTTTDRKVTNSRLSTTSNLNNSTVTDISVIENEKTLSRLEDKSNALTTKKANKRTLFDVSNNQVYLDSSANSNNNHAKEMTSTRATSTSRMVKILCPESDDDDLLLTQALNDHLERTEVYSSQKFASSNSPPAKKPKSLVQSLFEENDGNDENQEPVSNMRNKLVTKENAKIAADTNTSIYIEETSSEEDD